MNEKKVTKSEYRNQWIAKSYDRINLTVPKGQKEVLADHAAAQGKSLNAFINEAIAEKLERDKAQG